MPARAPSPCLHPGCAWVGAEAYCPAHRRAPARDYDTRRGSSAQRGYGSRWQRARAGWLRKHPLCATCAATGRVRPATVVDHVVPHRGDRERFWDRDNWQSLCKSCHDRKTGRGA